MNTDLSDLHSPLEAKLHEIAEALAQYYPQNPHVGVQGGLAGIALFFFYYARFVDKDEPAQLGGQVIGRAFELANEGEPMYTFCNGLAGLGWALDHLQLQDLVELDVDEVLESLDGPMKTLMDQDLGRGFYDAMHGGLGYTYYFLQRYASTQNATLKATYEQNLSEALDMLAQAAEAVGEGGLRWQSVIYREKGTMGYNTSLSHGMSSIAIMLVKLRRIESLKAKAEPLLKGVLEYMVGLENPEEYSFCRFPSMILSESGEATRKSRLAWCYGDLGLGLAFWHGGVALGREDWKAKAIEAFTHAAGRTSPEASMVKDASLCHGAYGNAYLFQRVGLLTGSSAYDQAVHHWFSLGLEQAIHGSEGYAGYRQFHPGQDLWYPETNLLEGIAGIGLAIMAQLNPAFLSWDECLLIS